MRTTVVFASVAVLCASIAAANPVAPGEVQFADGAIEASLTGTPGDAAAGRKVFDRKIGNCIACHAVSDLAELQFHGEVGPPLDGAGDRWSEAELRGIVVNAKQMFEGTVMPAFYKIDGFTRPGAEFTGKAPEGELSPLLTAQQVEDVVAYLLTLKE